MLNLFSLFKKVKHKRVVFETTGRVGHPFKHEYVKAANDSFLSAGDAADHVTGEIYRLVEDSEK